MANVISEVMTPDPVSVSEDATLTDAARQMRDYDIGDVLVTDAGGLRGMLTDRDIVVRVLAEGKDARAVHAGELAKGTPVTVAADDDVAQVLRTMSEHQVRRVPVLDGGRLVGIVAQADVARVVEEARVGDLLRALSAE